MANEKPEADVFKQLLNKVDKIDELVTDVRGMRQELTENGARLDRIDSRLDRIDSKLDQHDRRFDHLDVVLAQATEFIIQLNQDVKHHSLEISELNSRLAS